MAGRDGSDKRDALARRRTIGRIQLAAVGFVLGCLLGASLAAVILRPPPDEGPKDRAPPSVLAVEPEDGALLSAGNATFRIAFSETLAAPPTVAFEGGKSISIKDESFDGTIWRGAVTIPDGADGPYNLTVVSVRDLARNAMLDRAMSYTVDTAAPDGRAFITSNRTSVPFDVTWNASDGDGSGIARVELWIRDGAGPWTPLASAPDAVGAFRMDPGERETTFALCAVAVDRAGNHDGPCTAEAIVDYDATPPGASLHPQPYWALGAVDLSGVAANGASVADLRFFFSPDNATWQGPFSGGNATSPFHWTFAFPLGGGHYRLSARGRDARGWVEPEQSPQASEVAIGLDLEAPASRIDPVATYWHAGPVTLFANASDDRSGVASMGLWHAYRPHEGALWSDWLLAGSRVQPPWTFPFDFLDGPFTIRPGFPIEFLGGDGRYELATRARDHAGREEALPPIGQGDVALAYNRYAPEAADLQIPNFVDSTAKRTNVTWTVPRGPAPDVVRFEVHRGTTPAFTPDAMACENSETCVASRGRDDRTAWVPLPNENVTYYMRVRAIDDGGWSTDGGTYGAVFHGMGFDSPDPYVNAAPLPLGIAWSENLRYADVCHDCADAFKISLWRGQSLALSLAVPSTGDFRILVLDSNGNTVDQSSKQGFGVWESLLFEATTLLLGTYYVIVDWSNVTGPDNRNEGWYTLAAAIG